MNRACSDAALLTCSLKELLANEFRAHLAGSWATHEAHVPYACGDLTVSFSDIDVLIDDPPTPERTEEIKVAVATLARRHRVDISSVSVRARSEITAFWEPGKLGALSRDRFGNGRFMLFWALVGAVEVCFSSVRRSDQLLAYATVKFFFKMCRNLLVIRGDTPASYRDVARRICVGTIDPAEVRRAYSIKVGRSDLLSVASCEALLGDTAWQPLLDQFIDSDSAKLLDALREDIRRWHKTGLTPDASEYIAQLQAFDEEPALSPARVRVVEIHERQQRH